jgi:hypothetical protein
LRAPKADGDHGKNVVKAGNGMLEAAEEAYGFSFMDVGFRRSGTEEESKHQNREASGCFL